MSKNDSTEKHSDVISLADEEGVKQVLVNSVLGLWDVVNNLTRLKPSKHERYRVTIFGSARANAGRRDQAGSGRLGRNGLRYYYRRRPRIDAGCQRRCRRRAGACPIRLASSRFAIRAGSQCLRHPGITPTATTGWGWGRTTRPWTGQIAPLPDIFGRIDAKTMLETERWHVFALVVKEQGGRGEKKRVGKFWVVAPTSD